MIYLSSLICVTEIYYQVFFTYDYLFKIVGNVKTKIAGNVKKILSEMKSSLFSKLSEMKCSQNVVYRNSVSFVKQL
jgi:hypothetical protein